MITVALDADAPLGPNDLRFEIDDEMLEGLQAIAATEGRTRENLVIGALLQAADSVTLPADAALSAAQSPTIKDVP